MGTRSRGVGGGWWIFVSSCLILFIFYFKPKVVWSHWTPLYIYIVNPHELLFRTFLVFLVIT